MYNSRNAISNLIAIYAWSRPIVWTAWEHLKMKSHIMSTSRCQIHSFQYQLTDSVEIRRKMPVSYHQWRLRLPVILHIRLFVSWTVRNRTTDREKYNIYSTTVLKCMVYNISNEQFTVLSPDTTQNFTFTQQCIFTALHVMQTRYSEENSVCPSVCPSVCLSNACFVTKL